MKKDRKEMNQIKTLAALTVALAVCMPTANAGNWS
ncbi:mltA-interacting domain protein, partial [Yersinia pestis PY-60]